MVSYFKQSFFFFYTSLTQNHPPSKYVCKDVCICTVCTILWNPRVAQGSGEEIITVSLWLYCQFMSLSLMIYLDAILWVITQMKHFSIIWPRQPTVKSLRKSTCCVQIAKLLSCSCARAGKLCNDRLCASGNAFVCFTSFSLKHANFKRVLLVILNKNPFSRPKPTVNSSFQQVWL